MHEAKIDKKEEGYIDKEIGGRTVTTRGFRSTFKGWTRRNGNYQDEWSELALAHIITDGCCTWTGGDKKPKGTR